MIFFQTVKTVNIGVMKMSNNNVLLAPVAPVANAWYSQLQFAYHRLIYPYQLHLSADTHEH